MAHVVSNGGGKTLLACSGKDKQDQIPQRRHDLSGVPFPNATGILLERDVTTIVQAVLDAPMLTVQLQEFRGVCAFTRQAGDAIDNLMFDFHANPSLAVKLKDLAAARPILRQVIGHPCRRPQGPLLPPAVPFIDGGHLVETRGVKRDLSGGKSPRRAR
jgi:hypothetical protein